MALQVQTTRTGHGRSDPGTVEATRGGHGRSNPQRAGRSNLRDCRGSASMRTGERLQGARTKKSSTSRLSISTPKSHTSARTQGNLVPSTKSELLHLGIAGVDSSPNVNCHIPTRDTNEILMQRRTHRTTSSCCDHILMGRPGCRNISHTFFIPIAAAGADDGAAACASYDVS